jgi:hypothetical protein
MKTILKTTLALLAFIAFNTVNAQDAKTSAPAKHNDMGSWPELKAFHAVMAQTFHPSEEGNLNPIRERSGELNEKAVALEKSKIPADFNSPEIITATKELSAKTKALDDLIKAKGTDEKVTALLAETHESFHKIVGLCNKGDEHGHDIDQRKEHKE